MDLHTVIRSCDEVKEYLMEFLEKRIPVLERIRFKVHMILCPPCKSYMKRYNTSVDLAKNILDDPPPKDLVELTSKMLKNKIREKK